MSNERIIEDISEILEVPYYIDDSIRNLIPGLE
jgi:hypothetical protein